MKKKKVAIHINSKDVENNIKTEMIKFYNELNKKYKRINVVCIGSDRILGDCLGPLVGTFLEREIKNNNQINIYGTLNSTVHAMNIENLVKSIEDKDSLTIAVDASLDDSENIENIMIYNHSIKPGAGVGKDILPVGDLSITGIINYYSPGLEFTQLQSTKLSIVYNLADAIAKGLISTLTILQEDLLVEEILDEVATTI